jgi:hypothetical protein
MSERAARVHREETKGVRIMAIDTSVPRSRRALLGAAIGAGVATIASAIGRPVPAWAADGAAVVVGGEYAASSVTKFTNLTNDSAVLEGASKTGMGVHGASVSGSGVYGEADDGTAVGGESNTGAGVYGYSFSASGVYGVTSPYSPNAAVVGQSYAGKTGVWGYSGEGAPQEWPAPPWTGVYGTGGLAANTRGVTGEAEAGRGVNGIATSGHAVHGEATSGTAGYFSTADPKHGYALRAAGRVKFDQCAGVATIAAGASSILVTPGIDLTSSSAVVATLLGNAGAVTTTVSRCFVNATANTFTIYLTTKATLSVKVAWHVFG